MLKPFPHFASDEEAEDFVANADLTEYDWRSLRRVRLSFSPETGVGVHDVAADEPADPSQGESQIFAAKALPDRSVTKRRAGAGG